MQTWQAIDRSNAALTEVAGILGLRWAIYDARGERTGVFASGRSEACARFPDCPIQRCNGVCPGAATASFPTEGALSGSIAVCRGTPRVSTPPDTAAALASAMSSRREAELEMESTVRELAATYQELAIAYGTLEAISLPSSRELIAQSLLAHITGALSAVGGCFVTIGPEGEVLVTAATGMSDLDVAAIRAWLPSELQRHPGCDEPFTFEIGSQQVLACAIGGENSGRGVLVVCRQAGAPFSSREAKLLRASGRQAALAIRNRALVDELRALFVSTVQALVAAIEAKDPYTCGHSRRVAEHALATARRLGVPHAELDDIHTAAVVHDVGKIAVDTAILRKQSKLDANEWEVVRGHPERGAGIIACVPQLQHIAPAVRHHHERSDGQGYPLGLGSRQIPLAAGIIAVCDSYDAMTSQRPYRGALSPRAARRELILCTGTQFEPRVVEAFLETLAA